jgi:hypothetical protein
MVFSVIQLLIQHFFSFLILIGLLSFGLYYYFVSTKQSSIWLLYTPWGRTENSLSLSSPPGCSNLHTINLHAASSWVLVIFFFIQPIWNDGCINCYCSQKIKLSIYLSIYIASVWPWAAACARVFARGKHFPIGPNNGSVFLLACTIYSPHDATNGLLPDLFLQLLFNCKKTTMNPFFSGNTRTIFNLKICLESPKHRLFYLQKA